MSRPVTYGARLRELARQRGPAEALRVLRADGSEEALGWDALDALVDRVARVLAGHGTGQGDVVAYGLPNGVAHVALTLAVWRLGATTMVLDPRLPEEAAAAMKDRARARLRIGTAPGQGDLGIAALMAAAGASEGAPVADAVSCPGKIVLSGGSTGLPKMMCDDQPFTRIPGASWGKVAPALGFRTDQTQLVLGALSHNAPLTWAQNGLFEGNRVILMERFEPLRALEAIDRFGVGFVMAVPTMLVRMLDHLEESGASLGSLHSLYHTAAPCPDWLKAAWIDRLSAERVFEMYGSGENTGQTVISGTEWLSHRGSVGRGFETDIRIKDTAGRLLPPGQSGEIFMRPHSAAGRSNYVGPDAPPPRRDAEGFQSIGDMGRLDAEGYLYLDGRCDDVINTGAVKVHPERIEAALLAHPEVADAVVFGIEDRDWGQKVVACIVPKPGTDPDPSEIAAFLSGRLAPAEVPKVMQLCASLPRDGFGKIRRKAMVRDFTEV
ncbi:AMP-binding protein [Poseidonocella sp. HB161398]|uniref:AMP-binding protein n=1 Tax=Poseidonocella sp. HB161398 TaxID=2320855 RepID=UPI0011092F9C|nr:AMP-binding protein [Poseidonocella sp. HB161398]